MYESAEIDNNSRGPRVVQTSFRRRPKFERLQIPIQHACALQAGAADLRMFTHSVSAQGVTQWHLPDLDYDPNAVHLG